MRSVRFTPPVATRRKDLFSSVIDSTIDAKGRLVIPQEFRQELGNEVVITYCADNCLCIYPMTEYQRLSDTILQAKKDRVRGVDALINYYIECSWKKEFDQAGRMTITQEMRGRMCYNEENGRTIKVVGSIDHIEIWAANKREELLNSYNKEDVRNIKEDLGI